MKTNLKNQQSQQGFTLIELSIVLVIIGLIVGGVLVGQDMIKAAELRAAIGQLEKYDTAVNVFRNKYNGIPGDIATASNFGFEITGYTPNGNGVLDPSAGVKFDAEPAAFFRHLAKASLVQETIAATDFTPAAMGTTITDYVPASKIGKGVLVMAQSTGGLNYYMMDKAAVNAAGTLTLSHVLPPIDSFNIDTKMDDGVPTTGKVIAVDDVATAASATANAGVLSGKCVDSTAVAYQTSSPAIGAANACTLRIRASF